MNSANTGRVDPCPKNSSGRAKPTASPPAKGTTRLPVPTSAAARPKRRISWRSVSKPVTTSSSATPIHPTATMAAPDIGSSGRNQWNPLGQTLPKTEGPRSRPAASSPITAG